MFIPPLSQAEQNWTLSHFNIIIILHLRNADIVLFINPLEWGPFLQKYLVSVEVGPHHWHWASTILHSDSKGWTN